MLIENNDFEYEELSLAELATRFNIVDFTSPDELNVEDHGYEILSVDEQGNEVYQPLTHFIVKPSVLSHYELGTLRGTGAHRVLHGKEWVALKDHPHAKRVDKSMEVVDVSVANTQCYIANGQINHNTTSGGLALPFHASTRISLTGGKRLEDPKTKEFYGIEVNAYVTKNKVAAPFRKISFEIHFGKGIAESETLFDVLRQYCDDHKIIKNGKEMKISGTSAWKELLVNDVKTGEVLVEKKFYKSDFAAMMRDSQYRSYILDIAEVALVRTVEQQKADQYAAGEIDEDGYENLTKISETTKK
jgi:hypothetical protein